MKPLFLTLLLLTIFSVPALAASPASSAQAQIAGIMGQVEGRLVAQRDVYWHQGDYPRIIALDRIITAADPHFLDAYETGAWLMDSLGNRTEAQAYYRLGVANNPRVETPYFGLAFFYFSTLHDYPLAASIFQEGARLPGADINDWKMTAHSQEHAHEYAQAVATWRYIKKRWPHGLAVDQNLKRALAMQQAAQTRKTTP